MKGSSALIKNGRLYGRRLIESAVGMDGSRRHLFIPMVKDNRRLLLERQSSASSLAIQSGTCRFEPT